jgi:predicted nucleic acid-binding protein
MLCLLLVHDGIERVNGLESLVIIALVQAALWMTQRRCSSEDLSYWDGLLVAAASVTTGKDLISLFRATR